MYSVQYVQELDEEGLVNNNKLIKISEIKLKKWDV